MLSISPNSHVRTAALSLSVAGLAALMVRAIRQPKRSLSTSGPPVLRRERHMVPFGCVAGENRGTNPMQVPLYLEDHYFHARDDDRKNEEVLQHLREENAYTAKKMESFEGLRTQVYQELLSHVKETDSTCPYKYGDYHYYTRTEEGVSYKWHCRKQGDGAETVLINENELAKGLKHCDVGCVEPSPSHNLLAYSVDSTGYETYTIFIKDLNTGKVSEEVIEGTAGRVRWGQADDELYYSTFDDAHRVNKVWKHVIGTSRDQDVCLFTEDDEIFGAFFFKSLSGKYLLIGSSSSETTEYHFLDLARSDSKLQCVQGRKPGMQYSVDHHKESETFFIVTNTGGAVNFKLMQTPVNTPSVANWCDVFAYDRNIKTDDVTVFENYIVVEGREDGFTQVWVSQVGADGSVGEKHRIEFDEPIYSIGLSYNKNYSSEQPLVRLTYSSMTTPRTTYNYDMHSRTLNFLHETPCPNYDRNLYACERLEAVSADGVSVPMSMVYRKDKYDSEASAPLHLYGYGSYEISIDPSFTANILPLLDRGVVYVIAHIRGGGEMGRTWYEDAKYLTKKKTFEDFVACAQHLVDTKRTTAKQMTCEGRSAGGLLMGAVLNMRPDLFVGAVAGVPFVDVMNTMSDATIPLTTGEWEEWGNPNEEKYFNYMLSYSPYENVKAQDYPSILVTGGLFDPRVAYWEPMKWVARLRHRKTDENDILLKIELESGHFSASDRYHYLKEKAFDTVFLLSKLEKAA